MDSKGYDILLERLESLEDAIRALNDLVLGLAEPKSFSQIYTVPELAERWRCSESSARRIIESFGFNVVLGPNMKPRKPLCIFKSEVVKYEQAQLRKKAGRVRLAPKFGKTARGFNPFEEEPAPARKPFGQGVRKLGE